MRHTAGLRAQLAAKRMIDILAAGVALVLLLPVMIVIALAIRATSPGPVTFRQVRGGKDGHLFTILKFRTMTQDPHTLPQGPYSFAADDSRITRVGRLLRRTSLDELPQLFNVLRGDMSIVGPRPDLPHHVERYTAFQRQRLQVRPGITGWAQIRGRNQLSWEERIKLDVDYVQHWSLRLDARVVLGTVVVVLTGRGAALPIAGEDVPWDSKADVH